VPAFPVVLVDPVRDAVASAGLGRELFEVQQLEGERGVNAAIEAFTPR